MRRGCSGGRRERQHGGHCLHVTATRAPRSPSLSLGGEVARQSVGEGGRVRDPHPVESLELPHPNPLLNGEWERCACRAAVAQLSCAKSRAIAARSSATPAPSWAEVAISAGNAAATFASAASVTSIRAGSSDGFTASALVSTI